MVRARDDAMNASLVGHESQSVVADYNRLGLFLLLLIRAHNIAVIRVIIVVAFDYGFCPADLLG